MSFDVKTFRRALGCFATGIAVVTVPAAEGRAGFGITINSFTSVSLDPPLILFCLSRDSRYFHTLLPGLEFAVNILAEEQGALSVHFADPVCQQRFEKLALAVGDWPVPRLDGCLAHFRCRIATIYDGGDHGIVLARVEALDWRSDGRPLLFVRGRYGRVGELFVPATAPADMPPPPASEPVGASSGDAVTV